MLHTEFAASPEDAEARAEAAYDNDPFPNTPRALLSSADIEAYIKQTGLVYPYFPDALKSASYEMCAGGRFIYWRREGAQKKRFDEPIRRGQTNIVLPANSISYVQVESDFRLPRYIAVRFNLRISYVHRGLLLGTGPLVDPGFSGKLLIPLHNLTSDDCSVDLSKALIWVEFTKTSFDTGRTGERDFPRTKKWLEPEQYFQKANGNEPIMSSIPDAVLQANELAKSAQALAKQAETSATASKNSASKSEKSLRRIGAVVTIGVVIALASMLASGFNLVNGSVQIANSVRQNLTDLSVRSRIDGGRIDALERAKAAADARNIILEQKIGQLESALSNKAKAHR